MMECGVAPLILYFNPKTLEPNRGHRYYAAVMDRNFREHAMRSNDTVMQFGQHAGMPLYELVIEHPAYVRWLLSQSWLDTGVAASLRAAVAEYRADCAAMSAGLD
jgi:hypothetical protein